MDRPVTFEVATMLIRAETGKPKKEAMTIAEARHPDLFVEYKKRIAGGGPDHFEALDPLYGGDVPFEKCVAMYFRRGKGRAEAVKLAMKEHPEAFQRYIQRLKQGEKIEFNVVR